MVEEVLDVLPRAAARHGLELLIRKLVALGLGEREQLLGRLANAGLLLLLGR